MDYRNMQEAIIVRLDWGEDLFASLTQVARQQHIRFAQVSGIGAATEIEVGVLDREKKEYVGTLFQGYFEICSLDGNMTWFEEAPFLHLHMTFANSSTGVCCGGHLLRAVIGATCEIVIRPLGAAQGRMFSPDLGLNLLSFPKENEIHEN